MKNQAKFLELRARAGITQTEAAQYIADQTMRPCALRTVQAWEADTEKASARPCPDWAITALETRLKVLRKIA